MSEVYILVGVVTILSVSNILQLFMLRRIKEPFLEVLLTSKDACNNLVGKFSLGGPYAC